MSAIQFSHAECLEMAKGAISSYCLRDKDEEADWISDAALHAWIAQERSESPRHRGFVMRVIKNRLVEQWRRVGVRNQISLSSIEGEVADSFRQLADTRDVDAANLRILADSALSFVREDYRETIMLEALDYTAKEAAGLLGLTIQAYKSRMYRGRTQARRAMVRA